MKTKYSILAIASLLLLPSLPAAPLYNLSTADVAGAGQNTFGASTGTAGGDGGAFTGTLPTNLIFTNGDFHGATTQNFDYFVGKFTTSTLTNVGDTLSLSFTATATNFATTLGQALRFGLFNIGTATDGASSTYNAASGYRVDYGSNSVSNGIRQRTGTNDNLYNTGATPIVGTQTSSDFTFAPTGSFSGSFTLELLTGNQVKITSQVGGTSAVSITDTVSAFTNFNAFSFFLAEPSGGTADASLNFTTLTVTAIPEPSTYALFAGTGLLFFAVIRRKIRPARSV
jgi:hypothetical protein